MKRRDLFTKFAAGAAAAAAATPLVAQTRTEASPKTKRGALALHDYEPRSMLHVKETKVEHARFPVIDFHTHITSSDELKGGEKMRFHATPEQLLAVMDSTNIRCMVDVTGGVGKGLEETLAKLQKPHPDRFIVFTEPWWSRSAEPGYPKFQADQIERAHALGAKGIKVLKILGLYLREHVTSGPLVKLDDRRFDPMWETAGALKMPIGIHTSDPEAFFLPIDRFNERYEELNAHPDWSFHGKDFPSNMELQAARLRVLERHPKTTFVCFHVADSENLPLVSDWMDRHPNMLVEIAARIGELGRQPRESQKFFEKHQDRILFGTDATPNGPEVPQQFFGEQLYRIYYRFLETDDEYFDYAPSKIPPQGRWRISGIALPDSILEKVYYKNAARVLGLTM